MGVKTPFKNKQDEKKQTRPSFIKQSTRSSNVRNSNNINNNKYIIMKKVIEYFLEGVVYFVMTSLVIYMILMFLSMIIKLFKN